MATFAEKLKDDIERARIAKLWGMRIDATGQSRAAFCVKHGLDGGQLARWINGTNGPDWLSIERVESALTKEGV